MQLRAVFRRVHAASEQKCCDDDTSGGFCGGGAVPLLFQEVSRLCRARRAVGKKAAKRCLDEVTTLRSAASFLEAWMFFGGARARAAPAARGASRSCAGWRCIFTLWHPLRQASRRAVTEDAAIRARRSQRFVRARKHSRYPSAERRRKVRDGSCSESEDGTKPSADADEQKDSPAKIRKELRSPVGKIARLADASESHVVDDGDAQSQCCKIIRDFNGAPPAHKLSLSRDRSGGGRTDTHTLWVESSLRRAIAAFWNDNR